jgi:hypothetical protein
MNQEDATATQMLGIRREIVALAEVCEKRVASHERIRKLSIGSAVAFLSTMFAVLWGLQLA